MISLKNSLKAGAIAGVLWGWLCYLANFVSGVFPFEGSFAQNFITFSFGGAVFGVVTGGLLAVVGRFLPFRKTVFRAVFISAALWVVLRLAGDFLSMMEPERYHLVKPETVQGFFLALALGAILGLLLKKDERATAGNARA
ncbi:MAG: hypothetical protein HS130_08005 [Deltaproteobacteria bacterium]|nr:hypothetical protein [Deltaproteobacteria bacterium]MCL4873044.1 hypothetical protein [bacterium]